MRPSHRSLLQVPFVLTFGLVGCTSASPGVSGVDAGSEAADASTDSVPTSSAEVGNCHFADEDGGIACEAGSVCVTDHDAANPSGIACVPDVTDPASCGAIGCAWDCRCANVSASECACMRWTSTIRAKQDVAYVDAAREAELRDELLAVRLATYRYLPGVTGEVVGEEAQHLGFIVEDMPEGSPAVAASRDRVDPYGYVSMAVAALKVQARELEELRARLATLEAASRVNPAGASSPPCRPTGASPRPKGPRAPAARRAKRARSRTASRR